MKSIHTHMRLVLLSVVATLALGAVAASTAQAATEGPFYKIAGTRLASGQTKEVKIKPNKSSYFELASGNGSMAVECHKQALAPASKLLGSTGANFGSAEVTLEFAECNLVHGNGAPNCKVAEEKFKTEPLNMQLGYQNEARTGPIEAVFKAVKKGVNVATVEFEGSGCSSNEFPVSGAMAGEVAEGDPTGRGVLLTIGKEPAAAKTLQISFPASQTNNVWLETGGVLTKTKTILTSNGEQVLEDDSYMELELAAGSEWGIFTK